MVREPCCQISQWEKPYRAINKRLAQGEEISYDEIAERFALLRRKDGKDRESLRYPKLGVYVGKGASHSWLWFVALFERIGLYDILFLDEADVGEGGLRGIDVLIIGGGDTYAIAGAVQEKGADELRRFIAEGGTYIGSCAGTYLFLDLSGPPFTPFSRFTKVQMANVCASLPSCRCLPTKFSSPYNGKYVIHPVRESVLLEASKEGFFGGKDRVIAPLYGGPSLAPSQEETALARYSGFDKDTVFLTEKSVAEELFLGKAAAVMKRLEKGTIWLFGPHFEHPDYPGANSIMAKCLYNSMNGKNPQGSSVLTREMHGSDDPIITRSLKVMKRELSNARIMAFALETRDIHWHIGEKSYEPEKVRFFLETLWGRLSWLLNQSVLMGKRDDFENLGEMFCEVASVIKELVTGLQNGEETTPAAETMFTQLRRTTACFFDNYFGNRYMQLRRENTRRFDSRMETSQ